MELYPRRLLYIRQSVLHCPPPRPGFVYIDANVDNFDGGNSQASAGWALGGLTGINGSVGPHAFPITLQNTTFGEGASGVGYDGNIDSDDAPDYSADVTVNMTFYEADGVTPVPVTYEPIPTLGFVPMTPCRVVDTRTKTAFSGSSFAAGETRAYNDAIGRLQYPQYSDRLFA